MTRRFLGLAAFLLAACGSGERAEQADSAAVDLDDYPVDTAVVEPPTMPAHPDREAGRLAVRAAGSLELSRSWPARAGRCAQPSMLLMVAEEPGSGVSVMLELPTAGGLTGEYPVHLADSSGAIPAPASQVGIQTFASNTADAYQASAGSVEVEELTERRVSGRMAVTVRHLSSNQLAQVAGTFHRVSVEALPLDWCAQAQAARDSLAPPADTTAR
jgi:hypothetical protein